MAGLWGPGGGPGTIWKLDAAERLQAGRSSPRWRSTGGRKRPRHSAASSTTGKNRQLLVSDLETGMIHRLKIEDGSDLGHYDHGSEGRASFIDAASGGKQSLPGGRLRSGEQPPASPTAPEGDFAAHAGMLELRRFPAAGVGLGAAARRPGRQEVRLFYAVWSSQGFGKPEFAGAADEESATASGRSPSAPDGDFDRDERQAGEFPAGLLPRSTEDIKRAGRSNPGERHRIPGMRRRSDHAARPSAAASAIWASPPKARSHSRTQSRVLRFELDARAYGSRPAATTSATTIARTKSRRTCAPTLPAASISASATPTDWTIDPAKRNEWVWMTGDVLCSPFAPCFNPDTGKREDGSEVHGIQGTPRGAFDEVAPAQRPRSPIRQPASPIRRPARSSPG